jgi:hypothetical protein
MKPKDNSENQIFEINLDKICFIILKVREFEVKVDPVDIDSGSNPIDDLDLDILEARQEDNVYDELSSFIDNLNEDEALDLIALMWVGRGTFDAEDFQEARSVAAKGATHTPAEYLLGTPLLSEHLQNGLDAFNLTCDEAETIHL